MRDGRVTCETAENVRIEMYLGEIVVKNCAFSRKGADLRPLFCCALVHLRYDDGELTWQVFHPAGIPLVKLPSKL